MSDIPALEIFEALFGRLVELMSSVPLTTNQGFERTAVAYAVIMLPSVSKQYRALSKNEARWAWIALYERLRLINMTYFSSNGLHLMDAIPHPIVSLDMAIPFAPTPTIRLAYADSFFLDRWRVVNRLESKIFSNGLVNVIAMPPAMPYKVALLAQSLFKHFRSTQHHHPDWIQTCAHAKCSRLTVNYPDTDYTDTSISNVLERREFWKAAGFDLESYLTSSRCYCSSMCREQYVHEVKDVTCVDILNSEFDGYSRPSRGNGRARGCPMHYMLRSLLARNAKVANAFKVSESRQTKSISIEERTHLQTMVTKALNVETAVVIAAIDYSQLSKTAQRARIIGPRRSDWRQYDIMFARPLHQVKSIYEERSSQREPIITTENKSPRWIQTVKSRLLYIF